jgi:enoyl-CoA hydratase/carnithine racemase
MVKKPGETSPSIRLFCWIGELSQTYVFQRGYMAEFPSLFAGKPAASFDFQTILYEKDSYKAKVTFNRPDSRNAINYEMLIELQTAFQDAAWDDAIAVLILTGAGDVAFCAGADLKEQQAFIRRPRDYYKWMDAFIRAHEMLRTLGKPSIARLNGMVVGGGNEFNISCDIAVAASHVKIRQVGTSHGSVAAAGATQFLPLIVGDRRAREILLFNEWILAEQALNWGLVNYVVPVSELDAKVDELAAKLYHKFSDKTRYTRQQLNFWRDLSWGVTIQHARDWLAVHNTSPETWEGVESFVEKRAVNYSELRNQMAAGTDPAYHHGPPDQTCISCGATHLPLSHRFCGICGAALKTT